MRKFLFVFALIMSVFFTAQAGYITRGFQMSVGTDLKNYTLSFDDSGDPIAAGTMHSTLGIGNRRNSIVIIAAHNLLATVFPIPYSGIEPMLYDIEVRDFQRVSEDMYVLCGSRQINSTVSAFVAVITHNFTAMQFYEYQEANVFYSIWTPSSAISPIIPNYYVCGKKDNKGVVASINRSTLQFVDFYITSQCQDWEYHKIVAQLNPSPMQFVVSGKNPDNTQIGFSTFDQYFNPINSYVWDQDTESDSHCVVSYDVLNNNTVILASSFQKTVTLNPVTLSPFPMQIRTYRFIFPVAESPNIYVQDIGTVGLTPDSFHISVAGYVHAGSLIKAWHGYTGGFFPASSMMNNYYYDTNKQYEHYKIRYDQTGKEYTGGYYQDDNLMCALFGTPLTPATDCDNITTASISGPVYLDWTSFILGSAVTGTHSLSTPSSYSISTVYGDCPDFKSAPAPEYAMPLPEDESDIIALQDRIIVRDAPSNTNYQIYSVIGQLIQTGTTTPDISTAQLGKGVYILRLEDGKTFKFVK